MRTRTARYPSIACGQKYHSQVIFTSVNALRPDDDAMHRICSSLTISEWYMYECMHRLLTALRQWSGLALGRGTCCGGRSAAAQVARASTCKIDVGRGRPPAAWGSRRTRHPRRVARACRVAGRWDNRRVIVPIGVEKRRLLLH